MEFWSGLTLEKPLLRRLNNMFICFEGIAGAGKTTQVLMLDEYLRKTATEEVFVSAVYEGDRRKLVSDFMNKIDLKSNQNAIMFLFQALHAVQRSEIQRAIDLKKFVIADRWRQSFFAYHIYEDTFSGNYRLMRELDALAYGSLEPDITFLIDVPAEVAYDRYSKREEIISDNGLDRVDIKYFIAVRDYYVKTAMENNWHIIDGTKQPDLVFNDVKKIINEKL